MKQELAILAASLDEALQFLKEQLAFQHEVELVVCDLRWQALRCLNRDVAQTHVMRLRGLAWQLEEGLASRTRVRKVTHELTTYLEVERLKDQALKLLKSQRAIERDLSSLRLEAYHYEPALSPPTVPTIGSHPAVRLKRGERLTLRHRLRWNQFEFRDFTTSVVAWHRSIQVPREMKLSFETHATEFDYQVTAGEVAGQFWITLTPSAGNVVVVVVTVE